MVAQARLSLVKQASSSKAASQLLKGLTIILGLCSLLLAFLLVELSVAQNLFAILLAFSAGAILFRQLIACDVIAQRWKTAQFRDEAKQSEDPAELKKDTDWQLREADDRHRSILDALGAIVIRCDNNGVVLSINDTGKRNFPSGFGIEIGQIIQLPYAEDFTPELEDSASGTPEDIALRTKHGTRWYSLLRLSIRDGSGTAPIVQWILTDVTDRQHAEQKLREDRDQAANASEAKSRFLAMVSHEIRTPLNGVLGMADLLADTIITAEQQNYIKAIKTSGSTLLMLIDEVLDYSKIEAGKLELETNKVELAPLIERVVELLSPKAHLKGLQIGSYIDPAVPVFIESDTARLQQVLYNLMGNAIKFTDQGGVSLELSIRQNPMVGSLLEFAVRDTGPGMDEVTAARIFREFEQGEHGRSRNFDGAGLGLAISKRLAELMKSSLSVQSKPGSGSTFLLEMPLRPTSPQIVPLKRSKTAILTSNWIEAELVQRTLQSNGFSDTIILSEDSFAQTLDAVRIDYLLIGEEYVERVRTLNSISRNLAPEIIVFIKPQERARIADVKTGEFSGYLTRPIRQSSLLRLIDPEHPDCSKANYRVIPDVQKASDHQQHTSAVDLNVLVAEDNPINWMLVRALLEKLGHKSELAENGQEAVSLSSSGSFDVLLMDLHMPGLDGLEAIAKIRNAEDDTAPPLPIYVVSADVMPDAEQEAMRVGADGFLSKPLKKQDLEAILKKHAGA